MKIVEAMYAIILNSNCFKLPKIYPISTMNIRLYINHLSVSTKDFVMKKNSDVHSRLIIIIHIVVIGCWKEE